MCSTTYQRVLKEVVDHLGRKRKKSPAELDHFNMRVPPKPTNKPTNKPTKDWLRIKKWKVPDLDLIEMM